MTKLIDRVAERMEALGLNPTSTAREAGLKVDYVRDILRGRIRDPSALRLNKLAKALQSSPDYLVGEQSYVGQPPSDDDNHAANTRLRVAFNLRSGLFEEKDEDKPEPSLRFTVMSSPIYRAHSQWLEYMADDHADKLVPKGYYVQVIDFEEVGEPLKWDDLVIVERYRDAGALVERTLRQVTISWAVEGWDLEFRSHNPRFADLKHLVHVNRDGTPAAVDGQVQDVKIVGRVHLAYGGFAGCWGR